MDAQLDLGEVAGAQLSAYPVEADALAKSDFLDDAMVLAQVLRQPLEGRHAPLPAHLHHRRGVRQGGHGAMAAQAVGVRAAAMEACGFPADDGLIIAVLFLADAMHLLHFQLCCLRCCSRAGRNGDYVTEHLYISVIFALSVLLKLNEVFSSWNT